MIIAGAIRAGLPSALFLTDWHSLFTVIDEAKFANPKNQRAGAVHQKKERSPRSAFACRSGPFPLWPIPVQNPPAERGSLRGPELHGFAKLDFDLQRGSRRRAS